MTGDPISIAVTKLGQAIRPSNTMPDSFLVRAFVTDQSEEAATELVLRHGPMVYGVCRRIHPAEGDDAYQAVWLVFSRGIG